MGAWSSVCMHSASLTLLWCRQSGKVRFDDPPFREGCSCGHLTCTPVSEAGLEAGVAARSTLLLPSGGSCSFTQLSSTVFSLRGEQEARVQIQLCLPNSATGIPLWVICLFTDCLWSTDACLVLWEMLELQTRER